MATKKRKRKTQKRKKYSVKDSLEAKQLSQIYWRCAKTANIHAKPWRTDIPISDQKVFTSFIELARLLRNLKIKPRRYIRAQFEMWEPWRGLYIPPPSILHSQLSVDRWNSWLMKHAEDFSRQPSSMKEGGLARHRRDMMRLKTFKDRIGGTTKKILRTHPTFFSKAFLKKHGVWEEVAEFWMEQRT